jgi:general secretion pathway protein G
MSTLPALRAARRRRSGFSLAELMVVIVIIGLLATLVVPQVSRFLFQGKRAKAESDISQLVMTIDSFYAIKGRFPESLEELTIPDESGEPFLRRLPVDPWTNEYYYEPPMGGSSQYRVYTLGRDGQPGGEGEDQDIDNTMIGK